MQLRAEGISKEYRRQRKDGNVLYAVRSAELTLREGALSVLTGRSGSGKTTLLNILAGILTPTRGAVCCGGESLYAMEDTARSAYRNRHIGYVPQGASGVHSLSVLENVLLPCRMYGEATEETLRYAQTLLERLRIAELADAHPAELSGGELRRMAIARALIRQPEILLADEPTGDLDDGNTQIVLEAFRQSAAEGATVLLVTHDAAVLPYAEECFRMDGGTISYNFHKN